MAGDVFWRCSLLVDVVAIYEGISLDRYAMNYMIVLPGARHGSVEVDSRKQAQSQGITGHGLVRCKAVRPRALR